MNKPELIYNSRGESGNIFCILGQVRLNAFNALWKRVQEAGSYDEALNIIGEEVTLIDTAN